MHNHIKEILFALADAKVEFVLGGGVAAVLHGVERVTLDIDIALNLAPENLDRFIQAVKEMGLKPRVPVPLEALGDPEAVQMMVKEKHALVYSLIDPKDPLRYVDIFLKQELSYSSLIADVVEVSIDGRRFQVIGAERLLTIKKSISPLRDKDRLDIAELERIIDAQH